MTTSSSIYRVFPKAFTAAALTLLPFAATPAAEYPSAILGDRPLAYYQFNDDTTRPTVNKNSGSLGAAGNATNDLPVVRPFPGAIVGSANRSEFFDSSSRSIIPWNAGLNPANTLPFTVEAWFYPASDQINGGQCPINNRYAYATSTPGRQGWVFFQRAPDLSYQGKAGYEGVGWNFRMYRGSGGSTGLDVVSQVPYQVGKWTHVVVAYDPVNVTNASVTMFIDGAAAATNTWNGAADGTPGYAANTNDHDPAEAVNGPAGLSFGQYNNTASPGSNPYFGAIDEFAFYSNKLSAAQILAHYQNGTNVNRATPYDTLVKADNPVAYLRFDEVAPGPDTAINMGDLRSSGNATHTTEVRHPATSALAARTDDGAAAYHFRSGNATTTIPWIAANNPNAGVPFTFAAWLKPASDRQGGQAAFNNRWVGGTGRTGWVVFQRNPNLTYPISEGHGWEFRMYTGAGTSGQDVRTEADYTVGQWGHFVVTWEPQTQNGDAAGNGNDQWQGILTAYFNGVPVSTNINARYAANVNPPEDAGAPADFAVGSYNAKSGLGANPYEGDIDEVALYNNYLLTPAQILAHYQAGTNSHPATNYATLVLTAASDGTGTQRLMPATYLRFNDPARYPAVNSGTLGNVADGNLILTTNVAAGPRPAVFAGFDSSNLALPVDGLKSWASLNNPPGLNISNQITLEAWIKPSGTQGDQARIISHGPPTLSSFLVDPLPETNASVVVGSEVFLRIDEAGTKYVVGSSDGTNTYSASAPVPATDLGTTNWIHLAGTYDGTAWKLFRNGTPIATNATTVGALPVNNADWAIGSSGNGWTNNFAGSIDEVAIYNTALSASRIAAHYSAGSSSGGGAKLAIAASGTTVTITWSGGTLQEATNVTGQFADVPGSPASPLAIQAPSGTKFYRLRL